MLLGLGEPLVDIGAGGRLRPVPVLVFVPARRIDDTRDMAGAGQHEAHAAAEIGRAEQHRLGRRDVILPRGEIVDRHLDLLEIDRLAFNHHLAARQIVVEIAVAQIEGMIGRRHARGIGIPVQQVEGHRLLALEVVVDHIRPDQVVRSHQVERVRHLAAVEIAALGHLALERRDLLLVGKHLEVARIGEVDLARKKRRGGNPVIALGRHVGERDGKQRAADAIADCMHLAFAGCLLDRAERRERALVDVILERLLGEMLVGIDPRDDEHGQALIDAPFDEGFLRREIEHVELVDPGRHDQDRPLEHRRCGWLILDKLHQVVLEHDLAGGDREIAADLEHARIGLPDAQLAIAGRDVLGQHVHAARQVAGVGRDRLAQELGIGQHEVRRRDRVRNLPDIELGLLQRERIKALGVGHEVVGPFRRQQVGLLEEIEELVA